MPSRPSPADDDPIVYSTGPGRRRIATGPVVAAYADAQIERPCGNCGADANSWCVYANGTPRPIPCVTR